MINLLFTKTIRLLCCPQNELKKSAKVDSVWILFIERWLQLHGNETVHKRLTALHYRPVYSDNLE